MARIPVTWPSSNCDEDQISALDNPKKAQHWRTVKIPQEIAFYLKLCNRLHLAKLKALFYCPSIGGRI
eukprot:12957519-Ditylum_brightwellii.AAC.1